MILEKSRSRVQWKVEFRYPSHVGDISATAVLSGNSFDACLTVRFVGISREFISVQAVGRRPVYSTVGTDLVWRPCARSRSIQQSYAGCSNKRTAARRAQEEFAQ